MKNQIQLNQYNIYRYLLLNQLMTSFFDYFRTKLNSQIHKKIKKSKIKIKNKHIDCLRFWNRSTKLACFF